MASEQSTVEYAFGPPVAAPRQAHRPTVAGTRHMVSAGHPLAALEALAILEAGGNAFDAGVAAGLCTAVIESPIVGFAGVAPVVFYLADQDRVLTMSGVGTWPKGASAELFRDKHGGRIPKGLLRTVVPGAPDTWITLLKRFGTMSFGDVARGAIRLAREGFPLTPYMAHIIRTSSDTMKDWPTSRAIYFPGGRAPEAGEVFVQSDLARTMQYMADEESTKQRHGRQVSLDAARDAFYRGDIAAAICTFYRENGGLLTMEDMASIDVPIEAPSTTRFRGIDVYGSGPWGQGPSMMQILRILESFNLSAIGHNSVRYIHVLTEAIKLAAADRERYFGDPDFVEVPVEALLADDYIAERRALIREDKAWPDMPPAGTVADVQGWRGCIRESAAVPFEKSDGAYATSHFCVVDRFGNAISSTPSDGARHGPVVPGTGICPSGRGSTAWLDPQHPGCVAPGKRPRMVMEAALAIKKGEMIMPFGSPGSDVQLQAMLQVFLNTTVFGMDPQLAVEAPRFASFSFPHSFWPHSSHPGQLNMEEPIGRSVGDALSRLGHKIEWWDERVWMAGSVCAIASNRKSGVLFGAADPRRSAYAVGF